MSQPPSSENPMDSIWERDSMSRGSASARENNKSHEGELLGRKCDQQAAAAPPSSKSQCLQGLALPGSLALRHTPGQGWASFSAASQAIGLSQPRHSAITS